MTPVVDVSQSRLLGNPKIGPCPRALPIFLLLVVASGVLFSFPSAAAAGTIATFADGQPEIFLPALTCGTWENATGFLLPRNAAVVNASVTVTANNASYPRAVKWDIGADGMEDGDINMTGEGVISLNASLMNAFIEAAPANASTVWIPFSVKGCYANATEAYRFHNVSIVYDGAPIAAAPPVVIVSQFSGGIVTAGAPLNLSILFPDGTPSNISVEWFIDGSPAGARLELIGVSFGPGEHVVRANIRAGAESWNVTLSFQAVSRPLPPPPIGVGADGADVIFAALGVVTLVGALSTRPRVRFFALWFVLGAILGRLRRDGILDHFVRGRLYQLIADEPGIHLSELARRLDIGHGTAVYHLRVLQKADYVRVENDGKYARFYLKSAHPERNSYGLSSTQQAILLQVVENPGRTQKEVASALNLSASTVSRSLRHLRFLGLVSIVPKGKSSIVWPKYLGGSPSDYLKEAQSP